MINICSLWVSLIMTYCYLIIIDSLRSAGNNLLVDMISFRGANIFLWGYWRKADKSISSELYTLWFIIPKTGTNSEYIFLKSYY